MRWIARDCDCLVTLSVAEQAFDDLDAPMPYAKNLERLKTPTREQIVAAVRRVCYANGS